jgi:hypothetical protein
LSSALQVTRLDRGPRNRRRSLCKPAPVVFEGSRAGKARPDPHDLCADKYGPGTGLHPLACDEPRSIAARRAASRRPIFSRPIPAVGIEATRSYPRGILSPRCLPRAWYRTDVALAFKSLFRKPFTSLALSGSIVAALGWHGRSSHQIVTRSGGSPSYHQGPNWHPLAQAVRERIMDAARHTS